MIDKTPVTLSITRILQDMIRSRELQPDKKIPSQRVLSGRLGVSRASLREALLTLETLGLVRTYPARGTFVVGPASEQTGGSWRYTREFGLREVLETRLMLEPEIARHAARVIDSEQISQLRLATEEFERAWCGQDLVAHAAADRRFHKVIVDACANRMLRALYLSVQDMLTETQIQPIPTTRPERMARSIEEHRMILSAFERRDPEIAARSMRDHITNTARGAGFDLDDLTRILAPGDTAI